MKPLSVSALNHQIQSLVETTFMEVLVEGEISNLTKHNSGHIYFSIKDKDSTIACILFRGNVSKVKFELQNTQNVIIKGSISVYVPRGTYQIICSSIQPSGQGALHLAFDQLKQKLQSKGYFEPEHKKPLPTFPKKIALITSNTSAALQDMLYVAKMRWNLVKIVNFDTLVQGEEAKYHIVENLKLADSFFGTTEAFDVIVIARGGGSLEDLWAFNEEIVAQAIFEAKTPIVSAIGHEIDYVISDFVADKRAPTPSAAMEIILPDRKTWLLHLDSLNEDLIFQTQKFFSQLQKQIQDYSFFIKQQSIENKLLLAKKTLQELQENLLLKAQNIFVTKDITLLYEQLDFYMLSFFSKKNLVLKEMQSAIKGKNLDALCNNGYAQIMYQDKITALEDLRLDDEIEIVSTQAQIKAIVKEIITKL